MYSGHAQYHSVSLYIAASNISRQECSSKFVVNNTRLEKKTLMKSYDICLHFLTDGMPLYLSVTYFFFYFVFSLNSSIVC